MTVNRGKSWSADDDDTLRKMLAAGKSRVLISLRLKRSVSAVSDRASILGLLQKNVKSRARPSPSERTDEGTNP